MSKKLPANIRYARKVCPIGSDIYVQRHHISPSGMTHALSFYVVTKTGLSCIDDLIHDIAGYSFDSRHGGLRVRGCGMDMGFAVVYNFSGEVYRGSRSKKIAPRREGYALKSRWL